MSKKVVVYSKAGCGQCQFTKKYLEKLEVDFEERNLTDNPEWGVEVQALGFQSLPVVLVEGQEPFHGFQPNLLSKLVN